MNDDKTTAQMLQTVLDRLKANPKHPSFDADVLDVSEQAKNIADPALRAPIEKQCNELLGL